MIILSYGDVFTIQKLFEENKIFRIEFNDLFGNLDSRKVSSRMFLFLNFKAHRLPLDILSNIQYNPFGKPYFSESSIRFSLSQSKEKLVCGISSNADIGVDIAFKEVKFCLRDFETVFDSYEIDFIEQGNSLYKLWTRKESLIKALGLNLDINLREICSIEDVVNHDNRTWYFENIHAIPDYEICICKSISEMCRIISIRDIWLSIFNQSRNFGS